MEGKGTDLSDYIKREDAINAIRDLCFGGDKIYVYQAISAIKNIKGSYVPKIKKRQEGEWLGDILYPYLKCSVCGDSAHYVNVISGWLKYCPNCGAKMKKRTR